jgi:RNA-directed DNA polymerase
LNDNNWNFDNRLHVNGNNWNDDNNGHAFGIVLLQDYLLLSKMFTYNNLYSEICSIQNLANAWQRARRGKTKKPYVIEFEKDLRNNILKLREELLNQTYEPKPLITFILRDPKTRKISKSDFRDRIVHHAIVRIIEPLFDKTFIYDSCANRVGKGNLFALKRFEKFVRKISRNGKINGWFNNNQIRGYYLKADIKHYFHEINRDVLLGIIRRRITDEKAIWLIKQILQNVSVNRGGGRTGF